MEISRLFNAVGEGLFVLVDFKNYPVIQYWKIYSLGFPSSISKKNNVVCTFVIFF